MKLSICTISFRHHLLSIDHIADWAKEHHFDGIELWGVHAKNLADNPAYGEAWIKDKGLYISMISDYLPLELDTDRMLEETMKLSKLAKRWGTHKIRTFAGKKGSAETTSEERADLVHALRTVCCYLDAEGQQAIVETHPGTLTDSLESTIQLMEEVDHPALKVNFDVLHIWESGADPAEALRKLQPYTAHFHLKNITAKKHLGVFAPHNVYAAAGSREGMTPLAKGAIDYERFLRLLSHDAEASLEWFGPNVKEVLEMDGVMVREGIFAV
ncbi:sugar phosphate isomerase/epimerase family protein [Jeotgalibacillus haloalkalitolerans]|uniref:Sugar phosphate isomerase/epimerase n=1 Tax=Jeotgalibacillus haloalkalitolerans TaxID=3104292 RepID=A0ABU5KHX9_9BACL|nr:sugar phosphate isomerase/epimerase [Jeotgalibacillus sp. HH7-29]MDZ5710728.1 sugar phosphate isomerase/epimerase [Jeotgalibacillus sp. HH7-29]